MSSQVNDKKIEYFQQAPKTIMSSQARNKKFRIVRVFLIHDLSIAYIYEYYD